uniref:Uncharacterized protein n=1 Tax=Gopherus agassizii TaxID=38772 RepID=A0A452GG49_9SAUR
MESSYSIKFVSARPVPFDKGALLLVVHSLRFLFPGTWAQHRGLSPAKYLIQPYPPYYLRFPHPWNSFGPAQ